VRLKQGDREPPLIFDLSGTPTPDLTTASSVLVRGWRNGLLVITDSAPVTTATTVTHNWVAGETDTAGRTWFEVKVTWPGTKPQVYPVLGQLPVDVEEVLADVV
jgi:hypothetical protein